MKPDPFFIVLAIALAGTAGWSASLYGGLGFEKTENDLILWDGERPVFVFNHSVVEPTGGAGVARSGYIHPLYGPDGDILTDDFPSDHPHHRGVFFGWPRMTVLGKEVDLWHLRGLRPVRESVEVILAGQKEATFEARNLWCLDDGTETVREHLRYTAHAADDVGRAIDVSGIFTNLTDEPIVLRGARRAAYGGLNVRMDGNRPEIRIVTAEGVLEGDVNHIDPPSPWAAYSSLAETGGARSGMAIFQHPDNSGFPGRNWTLRRYGFLGAAWPGEQSHTIEPGEELELRYRLFVYRGTVEEANIAERFAQYRVDRKKAKVTGEVETD